MLPTPAAVKFVGEKGDEWWNELQALVACAEGGDEEAVQELRSFLANGTEQLSRMDWSKNVERHLLMSTGNSATTELIPHELNQIKKDLAGASPSPMERLIVDRIAVSWLHLHLVETRYANRARERMPFREEEYYQKLIDRTQRRYLAAIKSLAQVRRLLRPEIAMVNIADKQLNVTEIEAVRPGHRGRNQRS